jgi:hypothetical protein
MIWAATLLGIDIIAIFATPQLRHQPDTHFLSSDHSDHLMLMIGVI